MKQKLLFKDINKIGQVPSKTDQKMRRKRHKVPYQT